MVGYLPRRKLQVSLWKSFLPPLPRARMSVAITHSFRFVVLLKPLQVLLNISFTGKSNTNWLTSLCLPLNYVLEMYFASQMRLRQGLHGHLTSPFAPICLLSEALKHQSPKHSSGLMFLWVKWGKRIKAFHYITVQHSLPAPQANIGAWVHSHLIPRPPGFLIYKIRQRDWMAAI